MRTSSLLRKLAAALLLGGGLALAGPVVSPQSIIVNPVQSSVQLRVWTGRDPSGLGDPGYLPGSPIHIFVNVSQPAYVYLFNVGPRGHIDLILPNRYSNGGNYLQPGTYEFPSGNDPFNFTVTTPYGLNRVLALASTVPLNLNQVYQFAGQSAFASVRVSGPLGLGQALSIVVSPVPQTSWVSDAVEYSVIPSYQVTPPPAPLPPQPGFSLYLGIFGIELPVYPQADLLGQSSQAHRWNARFYAQASLREVYRYELNALVAAGFRVIWQNQDGRQVSAQLARGGLGLLLRLHGNRGGHFTLHLSEQAFYPGGRGNQGEGKGKNGQDH